MKLPRRQPRCSFCNMTGHNRTSCSSLKETKATVINRYIQLRAKYWELIKDLPFGKGALIRFVKDEYCYDNDNRWVRVDDGDEIVQMVVGYDLPYRISDKGGITLSALGRINEADYYNTKSLPVVKGYITNNDLRNKRYGYNYTDYTTFMENHVVCVGSTLDETVDRDKLQSWLNAEDIKSSYHFEARGRGRNYIFDTLEMSTEIVG